MDPLSGRPHFPPPTPKELESRKFPSVNPRPRLLPIQVPCFQRMIKPSIDPRSIARAAPETFVQGWTISAHIFPAAFPRHISLAGQYEIPPLAGPGEKAKKEWKKALYVLAQRMITEKVSVEGLAGEEGESIRSKARQASEGLWQSATRIRRAEHASLNGRVKGATLVVTHANGFHKESWEPAFKRLIELAEREQGSFIDEIWALEYVDHGDTGMINGDHAPKQPDRSDIGRDIANFLLYFLPPASEESSSLDLQLPLVSPEVYKSRSVSGIQDRFIIGVGHSMGGDGLALCGINYPMLFRAIILTETTLFPLQEGRESSVKVPLISGTIGRRASWPTRDEAKKAMLKIPIFAAFHPDALDAYLKYGLFENSQGVHLKCRPTWEAAEFAEIRTMMEGWELLPSMSETLEVRWIMGALKEASYLVGGPEIAQQTVWRPKWTSNVRIEGGGHLVVQERPKEYAEEMARFIKYKLKEQGFPRL